jgi:hypothetical protein
MRMEMSLILAEHKLDDTKSVTWQTQDNPSVAQRDCQMYFTLIHSTARRWVNLKVYAELPDRTHTSLCI